jgi:ubiquinone/menaquinone biosynthesis C-methylase UbiE
VREAAALVTEGKVIGIDPSPAMLKIAVEQTVAAPGKDRIEFRDGSAECIPANNGSITDATAINTIHHWHDLGRGLREVLRVLAPEGRLLVAEELLPDGRFGHSEGPSSDPAFVAELMVEAGFVSVTTGTRERGADAICYISAYKRGDREQ